MHVDSSVTIANKFYDPRTQQCAKEKEPTDIEVDQPVNQDTDKPKPVDSLASKLTQLSMDIECDNGEFVDRHRIWVPSVLCNGAAETRRIIPGLSGSTLHAWLV